jgi:hypothetical protein
MLKVFGKPTCVFLREEVSMFLSGSMLSSVGCWRLEWETALDELTVNIQNIFLNVVRGIYMFFC